MKIAADWLTAAPTQAVCAALAAAGHRALFVGGCVRNTALGLPVGDIDMATDAAPEAVIAAAREAGLKVVPTGLAHGTVTVVADGRAHEVTTFRRDVETFGRHARVAFDADLTEDAARRDLTINALYATPEGKVLDPLGTGLADLAARRVCFVGVPARRIAEDGLRILRFFRFHAHYADPDGGIDPEGLAACAAGLDALAPVSAERRGAEMRKLLAAADPAPALAAMAAAGVLGQVLPGADAAAVARLVALETEAATDPATDGGQPDREKPDWEQPDWVARLAALDSRGDAGARLRLSRAETGQIGRLRAAALSGAEPAELGWRLGVRDGTAAVRIGAALAGQPLPQGWRDALAKGARAVFPLAANDLMPARQGPALGQALGRLQRAWIASGMTLDRAQLLAQDSAEARPATSQPERRHDP